MKPAAFAYERPLSVAAALDLLAEDDEGTKIIAGGQSLVAMMNLRLARPGRLIDINRLPELDYIRREGDEIAIGALARHADVKASALVAQACPLMHMAYEWVAHGAQPRHLVRQSVPRRSGQRDAGGGAGRGRDDGAAQPARRAACCRGRLFSGPVHHRCAR
jgi:FAD binding domain in molybdopterin dehydrogenase